MKNIVVIGATGMLGSMICETLSSANNITPVVRNLDKLPENFRNDALVIDDLCLYSEVSKVLGGIEYDFIVNCAGWVKQVSGVDDYQAIILNGLLPHILSHECSQANARLIHFSTDCVFDGATGDYTTADIPNARDIYGRSKAMGEICDSDRVLTIRTSIIGPDHENGHGLMSWFLRQVTDVRGYTDAIFSGVTTKYLARLVEKIIACEVSISGLHQVAGPKISKYDLLVLLKKHFETQPHIHRDNSMKIDRALQRTELNKIVGMPIQSWDEMLMELKYD